MQIPRALYRRPVRFPHTAQNDCNALAIRVSRAPDDLLEALVRLLRLFDRPGDAPVLEPMIEREIVWRLLCSDQGGLVREIGLADSRLSKISHAVRWIREHYAEALRIEDLLRRPAGVGPQLGVRVQERPPQSLRAELSDRGLARRHHADQQQPVGHLRFRRHDMSSHSHRWQHPCAATTIPRYPEAARRFRHFLGPH